MKREGGSGKREGERDREDFAPDLEPHGAESRSSVTTWSRMEEKCASDNMEVEWNRTLMRP